MSIEHHWRFLESKTAKPVAWHHVANTPHPYSLYHLHFCSIKKKKLNSGVSVWMWTKFKDKLRLQTQVSTRVKQLEEVSEAEKAKAGQKTLSASLFS